MPTKNGAVLLIGAGDAIGAAVIRRFAAENYRVCIARRDAGKSRDVVADIVAAGGEAHAFSVDARQEEQIQNLFATVEKTIGPLEVCLYNAGSNVNSPLLDTSSTLFRKAWELACYGGFIAGHEAARYMIPREKGTILFTGATASLRGGSGFAALASAKFGLRAVAQAMAREQGPRNIHVAHLVIDGGLDSEAIRKRLPARSTDAVDNLPPDSLIQTRSVADAYWFLHSQPRDGWTHELDLRAFAERW